MERRIKKIAFRKEETEIHWEEKSETGEWNPISKCFKKELPNELFSLAIKELSYEACYINGFSEIGVTTHGLIFYYKINGGLKIKILVKKQAKLSSSPCNAHTPPVDLSNIKDTEPEYDFKVNFKSKLDNISNLAFAFVDGDRKYDVQEKIDFKDVKQKKGKKND